MIYKLFGIMNYTYHILFSKGLHQWGGDLQAFVLVMSH